TIKSRQAHALATLRPKFWISDGGQGMPYPIPLQIHVVWHPDSEDVCFPLAKRLYTALNRDLYQPLIPGIGIPVFFRCAGKHPAQSKDVPAPISIPDGQYDLRVVLSTSKLLLDRAWCDYVVDNANDVAGKRDQA